MASKYKTPTIEQLLDAGVHFGHQVKRWHPNMEPYIYTVKRNIHIIDLEQTERLLKEACEFLYETAKKGGKIVFIGTKKQARDIVGIEAKRAGAMYIMERWLGGIITNLAVIKKNNIDKLLELKRKKEKGELAKYTKKERLLIDREIERLERFVGGITMMTAAPDVLFAVDAKREKTAIREAKKAKIPVVALLDTNSDPTEIDYVIPGNDDAIKSIAIIVKAIADAVEQGYADYAKSTKEKEIAAQAEAEKSLDAVTVTSSEAPAKTEDLLDQEKEEVKAPKKGKK